VYDTTFSVQHYQFFAFFVEPAFWQKSVNWKSI